MPSCQSLHSLYGSSCLRFGRFTFAFLFQLLTTMTAEEITAVGSIFCQPGEFTVLQDGEYIAVTAVCSTKLNSIIVFQKTSCQRQSRGQRVICKLQRLIHSAPYLQYLYWHLFRTAVPTVTLTLYTYCQWYIVYCRFHNLCLNSLKIHFQRIFTNYFVINSEDLP